MNLQQLEDFQKNGYVVVPNIIDGNQVKKTVSEIWSYLQMSPDQPSTWYDKDLRLSSGIDQRGVMPFYHGTALWENRQNKEIYDVFSQLLQDKELIVSIDRVNMNPPVTSEYSYEGFMHFDVDTQQRPIPIELQGILALSDSGKEQGGFQCVPGFHHIIDEWVKTRPQDEHPRFPNLDGHEIVSVECSAGDLIIFDGRLPHGNTANKSEMPRLAQYITMWSSKIEMFDIHHRKLCINQLSAPKTRHNRLLPEAPQVSLAKPKPTFSNLGERLAGLHAW